MKKFFIFLLLLSSFSIAKADNIIDDYLYFPGGSYGVGYNITKSSFIGVGARYYSTGDIYSILFGKVDYSDVFGTPKYLEELKYKKLLFKEVFDGLYNEQKLKRSSDNKNEYRELKKNHDKEINLAKLRYDSTHKANSDYN